MNKIVKFPFDISNFFEKCVKHKTVPKNDFEKQAILLKLLEEFEDNQKYPEPKVNDKLKKHFEDYVSLRRELINFGYMQRNSLTGEYWVVKRTFTTDDINNNTLLKKHAKAFGY